MAVSSSTVSDIDNGLLDEGNTAQAIVLSIEIKLPFVWKVNKKEVKELYDFIETKKNQLIEQLENVEKSDEKDKSYLEICRLVSRGDFSLLFDSVTTVGSLMNDKETLHDALTTFKNHFIKFLKQYLLSNKSGQVIAERQNTLSDIKRVWTILKEWLESTKQTFDKVLSNIKNMISKFKQPAMLMDDKKCYLECVNEAALKLKLLSDNISKLYSKNSEHFCVFEKSLLEAMDTLKTVFILIMQAKALHQWNLTIPQATISDLIYFVNICDHICDHISYLDDQLLNIFIARLNKVESCLSEGCRAEALSILPSRPEISKFTKLTEMVFSDEHTKFIMYYRNSTLPHFDSKFILLLEKCEVIVNQWKSYWTGSSFFEEAPILSLCKDINNCLRVDFLIAMLQYVSITTRLGFVHPAIKDNEYTIQAIDNCKEILGSFSMFVSEMKKDQIDELFNSCSSSIVPALLEVFMLCCNQQLSDNLSLFLNILVKFFETYSQLGVTEAGTCTCDQFKQQFIKIADILTKDVYAVLQAVIENSQVITSPKAAVFGSNFDVTFFVVLRYSDWKISSSAECSISMSYKFNKSKMDNSSFTREFVTLRNNQECEYFIASMKVSFSLDSCGKKIYYKYIVNCPSFRSQELIFLYVPNKEEVDRCYRVATLPTKDLLNDEDPVEIYDFCSYPQVSQNRILSYIGVTYEFKKPNKSQETEVCIQAYLSDEFLMLSNGEMTSNDVVLSVYKKINRVFQSLKNSKIIDLGTNTEAIVCRDLQKVLSEKLLSGLAMGRIKKHTENHIVMSCLLLCRCLLDFGFIKFVTVDSVRSLLSLFETNFSVEDTLKQYSIIKSTFSNSSEWKPFIGALMSCLKHFCSQPQQSLPPWALIVAIFSLYHWLSVDPPEKPYTKLDMSPEKLELLVSDTEKLLTNVVLQERKMKKILDKLKTSTFLQADPKLQLCLLQACPGEQYSQLIDYIDIPVLLIGIGMKLSNVKVKSFNEVIKKILATELKCYVLETRNAVLYLVQSLKEAKMLLKNSFNDFKELLLNYVRLVFATKLDDDSSLTVFAPVIEEFIASFTGSHEFSKSMTCKEHSYWIDLFKAGKDVESWKRILNAIIKKRLNKVQTTDDIISIYKELLKCKSECDNVINILMEVIEIRMSSASQEEWIKFAKTPSTRTSTLFSRLLDKRFPDTNFTIKEVLENEIWKPFVMTYGNGQAATAHSKALYENLISVLKSTEECLVSGSITVQLLQLIDSKWKDQIATIFTFLKLECNVFKKALTERCTDLNIFKFYNALFESLGKSLDERFKVHHMLLNLASEVTTNLPLTKIKDLCFACGKNVWQFPVFNEANVLVPMLIPFAVMTSEIYRNDIFYHTWNKQINLHSIALSFSDLYEFVWSPSIEYCTEVLEKLQTSSISVGEVGVLFKGQEHVKIKDTITRFASALNIIQSPIDVPKLANHFCKTTSLSAVMDEVTSKRCKTDCWIGQLAKDVELWNDISPLKVQAAALQDILSAFNINSVELTAFANQDVNSELCSVTGGKHNTKIITFLKGSSEHNQHMNTLLKLAECDKLREWIRTISDDIQTMETFIGVALDTLAGEGDDIQDKLTILSELCGKFSPFIFGLDKCINNINAVIHTFKETWDHLTFLPDSLNVVVTCNDNLEWYLKIGELQGSIEQGAIKQLKTINEGGVYIVETSENFQNCSICLEVTDINEINEVEPQSRWTVEDIKELESKLVLITRQSSSWLENKEKFQRVFGRICLISEAVHKLKDFGHLQFLKWKAKYHCLKYIDKVEELDEIIEDLEAILVKWVCYSLNCRCEYPELNFYTTKQLVTFRRELTFFQKGGCNDINPQVFHLLHSTVGRPVDSTILLKKALESNLDLAVENTSLEEPLDEVITTSSLEVAQPLPTVDLTDEQKELLQQLQECGYDDSIALKAVTTVEVDDIYSAMEWCDDFEEQCGEEVSVEQEDASSNIPLLPRNQPVVCVTSVDVKNHSLDVTHIARAFLPFDSNGFASEWTNTPDNDDFMSLDDVGMFLTNLRKMKGTTVQRDFSNNFEKGSPNLIVTSADHVFLSVLQIYAEDKSKPLPTYDEVLLCSRTTTLEEVVIFWMRALFDSSCGRIFCLVHAEKLNYLVAEKAINLLMYISQGFTNYQLVIICSDESTHLVSRLHSYQRDWKVPEKQFLKKYLKSHLVQQANPQQDYLYASAVDEDKVIDSHQCSVGKSLYIRKLKDKLATELKKNGLIFGKSTKLMISVPLHGPVVTSDEVLNMFFDAEVKSCIIHIDIPQTVLQSIDDILFNILILQGLSDNQGRIWRCYPSQLYAIEMTLPNDKSYIHNIVEARRSISLLSLLPTTTCSPPLQMLKEGPEKLVELSTPMYQRVYKYLKLLDKKDNQALENFTYIGTLEDSVEECLKILIKHCGLCNPSWRELRHFVWFLNHQLSACEQCTFMRTVKGLKQFTVKFMIEMSRDFANSSMLTDSTHDANSEDIIKQHILRHKWEESFHSYLFFNKDRSSVTHVGLGLQSNSLGQLQVVDTRTSYQKLCLNVTPEIYEYLSRRVKMPTHPFLTNQEDSFLKQLFHFMNVKVDDESDIVSPDPSYVLTEDNLTKIMGIQTRFRCQIPVVLMGETGCGKTHLIRFMCKVAACGKDVKNMFILKIHGGTTEKEVISCLHEATEEALKNRKQKVDTVVFFDEANTSDVISLVKEIMCDGRCRGKTIPPFLKFVAACNPYKRHSVAMIERLKRAGLGWKDEESSTALEKLGEVPLRDLVYRVLQLPDSMKALVYDFGSLSSGIEKEYIYKIVQNKLKKIQSCDKSLVKPIGDVLTNCQDYLKQRDNECSFVSLRDVERAMILFEFFYVIFLDTFSPPKQKQSNLSGNKETRALLLALSVSYFARMESDDSNKTTDPRKSFEEAMLNIIGRSKPLSSMSHNHFKELLKEYQTNLLNCMKIENNIAKNAALRENLFMMFVCIELRIPLFLVGKPGSSKSLAKTIIQTSMKGKNSKNQKLKKFKHVQIHSHQCSQLSTAASIKEVFSVADKYQEKRRQSSKEDNFVSVVVLDEIGLAEASPSLPLKALHPLLEDGTEGSGSDDQRKEREKRVAFIGISNWALDPAKMNRGIMVTRSDPSIDELIESAKGICVTDGKNAKCPSNLEHYFKKLARAYHDVFKKQSKQFFGLRDFYSLIKMLFWMSDSGKIKLTKPQLEHAIKRNFSGFTEDGFDPIEIFTKNLEEFQVNEDKIGSSGLIKSNGIIKLQCDSPGGKFLSVSKERELICTDEDTLRNFFVLHVQNKQVSLTNVLFPDCWIGGVNNKLQLVNRKVLLAFKETKDKKINFCVSASSPACVIQGESTFIPVKEHSLVNPDCSPLGLIRESLINEDTSWHGESRYLLFLTDNYSSLQVLKHYIVTCCSQKQEHNEPFVLFGSSFPMDKDFAQICRNISEIRLCMETGRMIILLNLENLYESLYDLLNQYYIKSGNRRYVDLGLRSHRMKCSVHDQFKLVLIAEKEKVINEFPTPLVNRLEKHFINNETLLEDWQKKVCSTIGKWISCFTDKKIGVTENDVFIGFSHDTIAGVVLQASVIVENCFGNQFPKGSSKWNEQVLNISKKLLLQMTTPDAVIRMVDNHQNEDNVLQTYFLEQEHSSIIDLVQRMPLETQSSILLQVTTHSPPLMQRDIELLQKALKLDEGQINRLPLEAFQTEGDFLLSIDNALTKGVSRKFYQIYECEFGQENGNLISCCRFRLADKKIKRCDSSTLFILVVHLPKKYHKSNFVSFQEQPWICFHVDDLLPYENSVTIFDLVNNQNQSLSDLFYSEVEITPSLALAKESETLCPFPLIPCDQTRLCRPTNLCKRLHLYANKVVSELTLLQSDYKIHLLLKLLHISEGNQLFYESTVRLMKMFLRSKSVNIDTHELILKVSKNLQQLQDFGSFRNALIKSFDKALIPLFANIIDLIDQHSNLELLTTETSLDPLSKLWLNIYNSKQLRETILQGKTETVYIQSTFKCSFPFSWIIFNCIETKVQENSGFDDLMDLLSNSELRQWFVDLSPITNSDLVIKYIQDFVYFLDPNFEKVLYLKLLVNLLNKLTEDSRNNSDDFLEVLVDIHHMYFQHKEHIDLFIELASKMPTVIGNMKPTSTNTLELIMTTLEQVLSSLYLDKDIPLKGSASLAGWMQTMYKLHDVVEKALNEFAMEEGVLQLLRTWQRNCIMRKFIEYVVVNNENIYLSFAKRLDKYSDKIDDYQKPVILKTVATLLIAVEDEVKKMPNKEDQKQNLEKCWKFFLDTLSSFFSEEIIESLIECAFYLRDQKPKEVKLNTFIQRHPNKLFFLQSYIIKLIISNETKVNEVCILTQIKERICKSKELSSIIKEHSFSLLLMNYYKVNSMSCLKSEDSIVSHATDELLTKGCDNLIKPATSVEYLFGIAQLMLCCEILAKTLCEDNSNDSANVVLFWDECERHLLDKGINNSDLYTGPYWYLVRYIVRRYGVSKLLQVPEHSISWISHAQKGEGVFLDYGAVYNPQYEDYRKAIDEATVNMNFKPLSQNCDKASISHIVPLVLALYQRIQLSHISSLPSNALPLNIEYELNRFTKECKLLNTVPEVSKTVQNLVKNEQCGNFQPMKISKTDVEVRMLVIHAVLTVQMNSNLPLILVLSTLLSSPEALKTSFLPAMPCGDPVSSNPEEPPFPKCLNDHRYTPIMLQCPCISCGNLVCESKPQNVIPKMNSACGYVPLDDVDFIIPLSCMNGVSYSVIRCIIHSILLWAACCRKDVVSLLHGRINLKNIPQYFLEQIQSDICHLSKAIGRSFDESILIVHLVLKEITQRGPQVDIPDNTRLKQQLMKLDTIEVRSKWEALFEQNYISSITKDIDVTISQVLKNFNKTNYSSPLFDAVYMVPFKNGTNFLWQFCPQPPSLKTLYENDLNFQLRNSHPVLFLFLTKKHCLEATQYIPDILQLQKSLIAFSEANSSVSSDMEVIEYLEKCADDDEKVQVQKWLLSLTNAWSMCQRDLVHYDRLKISKEYFLEEVTEKTPAKFLLPTTFGPGIVTTALVDFLVITHNNFIRQCHKFLKESLKREWMQKVDEVHLLQTHPLHFVNCWDKLNEFVTTHCVYTVTPSSTLKATYDLESLENDLVQKFVLGKPVITHTMEIPQLLPIKEDLRLIQAITVVKKTIPQVPLPQEMKSDIRTELKAVPMIIKAVEAIETVIKLLQKNLETAPKKRIKEYMEKVGMSNENLTKKISEYCFLEHIVSVWKLLNTECAKIKVLRKDTPFAIRKEFMAELKDHQRHTLRKAAPKISKLDHLLEVLYDFIRTYVQYCSVEDSKHSLMRCFERFLRESGFDMIPNLKELFADNILLSQVDAVWKFIVQIEQQVNKVKKY